MSTINMSKVRINMEGCPYDIFQKDHRDQESLAFYQKYYINKEGKLNSKYHKRYFVGISTMVRAMRILGAHYNESLNILDGEGGNHLNSNFAVFKKGEYLGCIFLSSTGSIDICINQEMQKFQTYNCHDFLKKCREIRNYLELDKPQ